LLEENVVRIIASVTVNSSQASSPSYTNVQELLHAWFIS